jgi:predicted DNA binding CopG/RHH family protein
MQETTVKTRYGRKLVIPSDEENARIHAAALADPDAQPWTDEQLEVARPVMRFGYGSKTRINIRVNNRTLEAFKARAAETGGNYQTLMNEALTQFVQGQTLAEVVRETLREELTALTLAADAVAHPPEGPVVRPGRPAAGEPRHA